MLPNCKSKSSINNIIHHNHKSYINNRHNKSIIISRLSIKVHRHIRKFCKYIKSKRRLVEMFRNICNRGLTPLIVNKGKICNLIWGDVNLAYDQLSLNILGFELILYKNLFWYCFIFHFVLKYFLWNFYSSTEILKTVDIIKIIFTFQ